MQEQTVTRLKAAFSPQRFEAHRPPGGSDAEAVCCYLWNLSLCEALICMLQTLEVVFRNTLHKSIGDALHSPEWILNGPQFLGETERESVESARKELKRKFKPIEEPRMVAELNFGFWTSLADSRYDRLWPKIIKTAFPAMPNTLRTRGEISSRANGLRRLRNAVFHHHSIWHWKDLAKQHQEGYTMIEWISPEVAKLTRGIDCFTKVHADGMKVFQSNVSGIG